MMIIIIIIISKWQEVEAEVEAGFPEGQVLLLIGAGARAWG
jgi:hypothetical protein